ncbi:MAG: asparagine synthase (glutamine-hydrolyzing) [Vicinamibacterales bacterium]
MCGIAGQFRSDAESPIDRDTLGRMTSVLAHRGPDGDGFYVAPGIGLGHRRLSVIDLASGAQPMANEDRTVWVAFNGEIYNFDPLRRLLESLGHRFQSRTDTEVIVHAYEEWGDRAVERFRGMFAYALWDGRRRRLLLVRDRLGVKPLFYSRTPHGLSFGSEIKALLQDPAVDRRWSAEAIDAYLALSYVPSPGSAYVAIEKLPPGHYLVAEGERVSVHQYWDLALHDPDDAERLDAATERVWLDRLEGAVDEAVRLRLVSDVPLGAFLSGGIDSSTVVAAMVAHAPGRVVTTSVGFDEAAFNELESARIVARALATDAHETVVRPQIADLLPRLAWHFDEPFSDSSAVPTFYVSRAARERVTVALSGDGGDEVWAGYARHYVEQREMQVRRWLGPAAPLAGRVATALPLRVKGTRSLRHLAVSPAEACARKHAYGQFEADERRALYSGDFARSVAGADPLAFMRAHYHRCASGDPVTRALYVDLKTYLPDDILVKVDRMSMAVSLEAREPLLDHELVTLAASVPTALKLRRGRGKYLLRRLLARRLPAAIVNRPKQGFAVPIAAWLRGPLKPVVDDLLLGSRFAGRGIFDVPVVRRLWREHADGSGDHRHRLWSLIMLELWFREFVDGPTAASKAGVAA